MTKSLVRGLRLVAAATLVAGFLASPASSAHASWTWTLTDGFETNAAATWSFDIAGSGQGTFEQYGDGPPHTGSWYADEVTFSGWIGVRRTIAVPISPGMHLPCTLMFWVMAQPGQKLNIEAIDQATWTYDGVKSLTTTAAGNTWVAYSTAFTTSASAVVVRLTAGNYTRYRVKVDDMYVTCTYA